MSGPEMSMQRHVTVEMSPTHGLCSDLTRALVRSSSALKILLKITAKKTIGIFFCFQRNRKIVFFKQNLKLILY